ncbi:MAG: TetR/AcrR family transcriptional regulator [Gemmatimonadota bacterium]
MARPKAYDEDTALEAAAELFWSRGYEAASMADLESAMQMGRQSIYNAFGDKRSLFMKALDRYIRTNRERIADSLLAPEADLTTIREHFESMVEYWTTGPRRGCLVANSILEVGEEDQGIAASCQFNQQTVLDGFENALQNAVSTGQIPAGTDVEGTARMLVAQVYGMTVLVKGGATKEELSPIVDALLRGIES